MEKKKYLSPCIKVYEMQCPQILAGSETATEDLQEKNFTW